MRKEQKRNDPFLQALGEAIRRERESRGHTQRFIAERSGIRPPELSNIEHGHTAISVLTLRRLAAALGCEAWELIWDADHIHEI